MRSKRVDSDQLTHKKKFNKTYNFDAIQINSVKLQFGKGFEFSTNFLTIHFDAEKSVFH